MLLSAVIGGAFSLLALAIDALRDSEERANHALQVLVAANRLERLMIDVETAQRGFIITGKTGFLQPWYQARAGFATQAAALDHLAAAGEAGQGVRAQRLTRAADSYIREYSVPLVTAAQSDLGSARTAAVTVEGNRRVNALRDNFDRFIAVEGQIFEAGRDRAAATARWALVAATVSVAGSIVLILLSGGYLARSVVRPVRRASAMAGQVAGGDLTARIAETGPGEVGTLERALNTMAGSLETGRGELRRIAEEQAALRRVATLVARGVSPPEVFGAVAAETGHVLAAECTAIARFEPDGRATIVGSWARSADPGLAPPLGSRWPADEASVAGQVQRTGAGPRSRLRGCGRGGAGLGPGARNPLRGGQPNHRRGTAVGGDHRVLWAQPGRALRVLRTACSPSPNSSPRRLRIPRAAPSSQPPARGSSLRPTRPAAASSATSTTGRSSG